MASKKSSRRAIGHNKKNRNYLSNVVTKVNKDIKDCLINYYYLSIYLLYPHMGSIGCYSDFVGSFKGLILFVEFPEGEYNKATTACELKRAI